LTPDDLLTGVIDGVLSAVADGAQEPVLIINGMLGPDRKKRRETRCLGEIPPVVIDAILQSGVAFASAPG
jgi:hypothetical protein